MWWLENTFGTKLSYLNDSIIQQNHILCIKLWLYRPIKSNPMLVNGGAIITLSAGSVAIFCLHG